MNPDFISEMAIKALWISVLISLPPVIVAAAVGLAVSVIQTLTQVQEQTLSFLLKMLAVSATLFLTFSWMGREVYRLALIVFEGRWEGNL